MRRVNNICKHCNQYITIYENGPNAYSAFCFSKHCFPRAVDMPFIKFPSPEEAVEFWNRKE